jgi:uncharacterized short protein YbdD (DUF466 family)
MKAKFTFNLPEENYEYKIFCKADDLLSALWDYSQYLRHQERQAETPDNIEIMRKRFYEVLEDNGVRLHELI